MLFGGPLGNGIALSMGAKFLADTHKERKTWNQWLLSNQEILSSYQRAENPLPEKYSNEDWSTAHVLAEQGFCTHAKNIESHEQLHEYAVNLLPLAAKKNWYDQLPLWEKVVEKNPNVIYWAMVAVGYLLLVGAMATSDRNEADRGEPVWSMGPETNPHRRHNVYVIDDPHGDTGYIGRTNDLARREREHRSSGKIGPGYTMRPVCTNATFREVKVIERNYIREHYSAGRDGLNKIRFTGS